MELGVSKKVDEPELHLIPFTVVPKDGMSGQEARVSNYFVVKNVENGGKSTLKTSFRGRDLQGVKVTVPEGYVGLVASVEPHQKKRRQDEEDDDDDEDEESDQDEGKQEVRKGQIIGKFSEFVLWEHDVAPLEIDNPFEWLKWPTVASILHAPVTAQELDARTEEFKDE